MINNKNKKITSGLKLLKYWCLLAVLLLIAGISSVGAQTTGSVSQSNRRSLTIVPPTVEQKVKPGDQREGKLKIINDSDEELTFNVVVRDFIVEDNQGTPKILPPNTLSNKYSASAWIGIAPDSFTVAPRQKQEFQYFMQVPVDARPGGHYAAVVYEPTNLLGVTGTGTAVNTQLGTLFYVNVEGPITEDAKILQFRANTFQEYGPVKISTEIKNLSDLHIRPNGTITVKNIFGQKVASANLDEHNIFPEASYLYANALGKKFMAGRYTANLYASYGALNNRALIATVSFFVFPWKIATVALLIAVAIVLAVMVFQKRKNVKKEEKTSDN